MIRALEAGRAGIHVVLPSRSDTAIAMATAKSDGIVYQMEHNPWDIRALPG